MTSQKKNPNLIKTEINIFLTAIMFFTRIPVPHNIDHSSAMLQKSARYFSWVGILVGVIGAASFFLFQKIFSPSLSIAISMLITIYTTGAFHEDGFADCCDGFGGGYTKEKILLIMKDSRLGTFGVVGLIFILGLKFLILQELFLHVGTVKLVLIMISAHAVSRLGAVNIMQYYNYVQDTDVSKSKPLADRKLTIPEFLTAIAGAGLPLFFLPPVYALSLVIVAVKCLFCGQFFYKRIGGYTGDCLGATQQVCEIGFYVGVLLIIQLFNV